LVENNHISYGDLLRIISGYSGQGATTKQLANLYDRLIPPDPPKEEEKEITTKILNIIAKQKIKERSIAEDARRYILNITGQFSTGNIYSELNITGKEDKDAIRQLLSRMVLKQEIEKIGTKSGLYLRHDKKYKIYDLDGDVAEALDIRLPLNIHRLGDVCGGDIISVWGEKSTGKSAFGLYTTWLNKNLFPGHKIRYIQNGELKPRRVTKRLMKWPQETYPFQTWKDKVEFIDPEGSHWADIVDPDGFNVIDYIERLTDAFLIPEDISKIQAKMNKGVALVMVQKDPNKTFGAGGAQLKNKPTLIVALTRSDHGNRAEIIDIKDYDDDKINAELGVWSPNGLWMPYKLVKGWKFLPQTEKWMKRGTEKIFEEKQKEKQKMASYGVSGVGVAEDEVFVHEED
jgi:hypothetical protein